jgi:cell wall assembly regulator SMI1
MGVIQAVVAGRVRVESHLLANKLVEGVPLLMRPLCFRLFKTQFVPDIFINTGPEFVFLDTARVRDKMPQVDVFPAPTGELGQIIRHRIAQVN